MTNDQLKIVHIAKSQLKLSDGEYRLILRNVGGVQSSKDLDNQSLEKVMAFFEERGFRQKDQAEDYWRRKYHAQGQFCGERISRLIHQLGESVKYPLDSLVAKASKGRTAVVEQLNPSEANQLVEMLKSIAGRSQNSEVSSQHPANATTETRRHGGQLAQGNLFGMPDVPRAPKIEDRRSRIEKCATAVSAVPVTDDEVPF